MEKYVIYIHTRYCLDGFIHRGFLGDTGYPTFSTKEKAYEYINKQSLGWRWSGYCTVREYNGEFEEEKGKQK